MARSQNASDGGKNETKDNMSKAKQKVEPVAAAKAVAAVHPTQAVYVRVIDQRGLEQLYPTRGELTSDPDGPGEGEVALGALVDGGAVLIRNTANGHLRLAWPHRYLVSLGLGKVMGNEVARRAAMQALPQIFAE